MAAGMRGKDPLELDCGFETVSRAIRGRLEAGSGGLTIRNGADDMCRLQIGTAARDKPVKQEFRFGWAP